MAQQRLQIIKDIISRKVPSYVIGTAYGVYRRRLLAEIKRYQVPQHVGVIMDGNRRLARTRGLPAQKGHDLGLQKAEEMMDWCRLLGIRVLTLYAFSTENFKRPQHEVDYLMSIFRQKFASIPSDPKIHRNRVKVRALGDRSLLPNDLVQLIQTAESATSSYEEMVLNICIAYGGRGEIVQAMKAFLIEKNGQEIDLDDVDVQTIHDKLFTNDLPDPDLIIRTGGELRLSNFLLFQAAYAELFFINSYFPLLREIDFLRIIREFQRRERRYGK